MAAVTAIEPAGNLPGVPCLSRLDRAECVVAWVCSEYSVARTDLLGVSREPLLVEARRVAIGLMTRLDLSSSEQGRAIGRDHATVLHHQAVLGLRPAMPSHWWRRGGMTDEEREMVQSGLAYLRGAGILPAAGAVP